MEKEKRRVIIDCDPGIDNSLAIMLALSMETLQVEGITIVCGNGDGSRQCEKSIKTDGLAGDSGVSRRGGAAQTGVCKCIGYARGRWSR